jgi:dihydroorotase
MITSEVTPCHLYFSDEDYAQFGAKIKCNPAIKSEKDRSALRQAFQTGLIDTVATDHAPHLLSDKEGDALHAASGIPSIQFSLLTMIELSKCCAWGIEKVCEKMSHAPATLFDIDRRGFIRKGYYADLVIIDTKSSTTVSKENILSKCGWSPFEGKTFSSKIVATLVNGQCVYKNKESFISKSLDIVNELVSMPLAFRK